MDKTIGLEDFKHGIRVSEYAVLLAKEIGMSETFCKEISFAGIMHDVGKAYINPDIIQKKGPLTQKEREIVKNHILFSAKEAMDLQANPNVIKMIYTHHENWNGTGYEGLIGENIPIGGRILRICDVFDALTSNRPYHTKVSRDTAFEIMDLEEGFYDPDLFDIFKEIKSRNKRTVSTQIISFLA